MEIKVFGKSIFEFNKAKREGLPYLAQNEIKESACLLDFYSMSRAESSIPLTQFVGISDVTTVSSSSPGVLSAAKKEEEKKDEEEKKTPKDVYTLKLLNAEGYQINVSKEYVDAQLEDFKTKLEVIKLSPNDMGRGVQEIASVIQRLENRRKYAEFAEFFEEYAYTTTTKIEEVLAKYSYLQLGTVGQFVADLPAAATRGMKAYTDSTMKLCGKKPVFYIIADKKDFQKTQKRRDPILLAQSPFAHAWQILGAWDKEVLLLEEL